MNRLHCVVCGGGGGAILATHTRWFICSALFPFISSHSCLYRFFSFGADCVFVLNGNNKKVTPESVSLTIDTDCHVPKLGLMLVGWGGNNGSTITAALEANRNKLEWRTKEGMQKANWFGSITQASTVLLGNDANGQDVFVPMNRLVPMVNPNDIGLFWFNIVLRFVWFEQRSRRSYIFPHCCCSYWRLGYLHW